MVNACAGPVPSPDDDVFPALFSKLEDGTLIASLTFMQRRVTSEQEKRLLATLIEIRDQPLPHPVFLDELPGGRIAISAGSAAPCSLIPSNQSGYVRWAIATLAQRTEALPDNPLRMLHPLLVVEVGDGALDVGKPGAPQVRIDPAHASELRSAILDAIAARPLSHAKSPGWFDRQP